MFELRVVVQGRSRSEAAHNAWEAVIGFTRSREAHGEGWAWAQAPEEARR